MNRKIFFIADTHFYHKNVIKYDKRGFSDVYEMNKTIIDNWNKVVSDNDVVYILGDFIFGSVKQAMGVLNQLKGRKHLIVGNHDNKILSDKNFRSYFESINDYKEIYIDKRKVILFHYPIADWCGMFNGSLHLYGHVHTNGTQYKMNKNSYNVGAGVIGFTPRTLNELIEMNKEKENE